MPDNESNLQNVDDKETHHHSHHHHHHHHSHHSHKSGSKNKFIRFLRHNQKALRYIAIALLLAVVLIIVSFLLDGNKYSGNSKDIGETVKVTDASIQVEIPFYTEPVSLVFPIVDEYLKSNSATGAGDYYNTYRESGQRFDIGVPVVLNYDIKGIPNGYSVDSSRILVSETKDFGKALVFVPEKGEKGVQIYNLKTNTQYYYQIELTLSDGSVTSAQGAFKTAETPRMLKVDGAVNVRNIGGWKTMSGKTVRQGLLLRGSELDGAVESKYFITKSGIETLINELKISTEMDLRSPEDNKENIHPLGNNVRHICYGAYMYTGIFDSQGSAVLRKVFSDLANSSNYPVYLHCTYGVDRTGTVCYLLGALLGVDEYELIQDYQLSVFYHSWVNDEEFALFLKKLQTYSGNNTMEKVENFLLSIGVTHQEIESIRNIFLG